jgi:acetyl-CoA carboxylase alpha subunit
MTILAEQQTEIARMRERISVLERLATDEDSRVAKEIERLRKKDQGPEARG